MAGVEVGMKTNHERNGSRIGVANQEYGWMSGRGSGPRDGVLGGGSAYPFSGQDRCACICPRRPVGVGQGLPVPPFTARLSSSDSSSMATNATVATQGVAGAISAGFAGKAR